MEETREMDARWRFDNSYARLPEALFSRVEPVKVARPRLAILNERLASELGLDTGELRGPHGAVLFAGNRLPQGAEPIAQAYAGHQFGHFTDLGDGRAVLLGEHLTPDGWRFDVQLKGSGRTPYSRRGDGRAALGPMLREYVVSEAMHALGIPTTRSLAVATTGETVWREGPLAGAVLARVASSHIRVGTFEYAAARGDRALLEALTRYTVQRHFPAARGAMNEALALLEGALELQAALVARWMCVGFVHGVMNTDNMALGGETIDYGPCAFMDCYDPATVFSSIDRVGRYAYGNQPAMAHWNLARLAEALLPLLADDQGAALEAGEAAVARVPERFGYHYRSGLRAKLGLAGGEPGDAELALELLDWMRRAGADFTNTFAALTRSLKTGDLAGDLAAAGDGFPAWLERWTARLGRQALGTAEAARIMSRANPVVIPRNHRVEEALVAAEAGDYSVMGRLLDVLAAPFDDSSANEAYRSPPPPGNPPYRTFCGT
jgi:uncharacterized protein YdiU (UPF0061 family)